MYAKEPETLKELADWYFDLCELWQFESLDADDHLEVLKYAFTCSDCGPFAAVLHEVTGWQVVNMGQSPFAVHSLNRTSDGRLVDAYGWVTEAQLRKRYRKPKLLLNDVEVGEAMGLCSLDEDESIRIMQCMQCMQFLPDGPFQEAWMQIRLADCIHERLIVKARLEFDFMADRLSHSPTC